MVANKSYEMKITVDMAYFSSRLQRAPGYIVAKIGQIPTYFACFCACFSGLGIQEVMSIVIPKILRANWVFRASTGPYTQSIQAPSGAYLLTKTELRGNPSQLLRLHLKFWLNQAVGLVLALVDYIDFVGLGIAEYEEIVA